MSQLIIAIDGPAGAGKGTLALRLSAIYDLAHLDTGLLYRAVALKVMGAGDSAPHKETAIKMAASLTEEDLETPSLREEKVGNLASEISLFPEVRDLLLDFQRNFANHPHPGKQGVVLDGRDIGLVVLPEAPCKIFVIACPEVRATRRLKELHQKGIHSIYENVLMDIKARDTRDQTREVSPLRPATDAVILDTSELGIDEVIEKACQIVDSKYPKAQKIALSSLG